MNAIMNRVSYFVPLSAAIVFGACIAEEVSPPSGHTGQPLLREQGFNLNGFNLNGFNLNGFNLNGFNLNGTGASGVDTRGGHSARIVGSQLQVVFGDGTVLRGAELVGAVFSGRGDDGPIELRIEEVQRDHRDPSVWLYRLRARRVARRIGVRRGAVGVWRHACPLAPWRDGEARWSIAISGVYDDTATRVPSTEEFTFSCTAGVIAKCIDWGYKPWAAVFESGRRGHFQPGGPLHQACVRMATADYCGDGTSSTENQTLIDIEDRYGIQVRDGRKILGHGDSAVFGRMEAAWGADGPLCLATARLGDSVCAGESVCDLDPNDPVGSLETMRDFFAEFGGPSCSAVAAIDRHIADIEAGGHGCSSFSGTWDVAPEALIVNKSFGWDSQAGSPVGNF